LYRDGIFGHQFDKRLESFAPCYSQVPSTGGFYRKPFSSLILKIYPKKSAKQENLSLFMNAFCRNGKPEKPDKNLSLRGLEFMPRNLD
jgi:hypothetical protein